MIFVTALNEPTVFVMLSEKDVKSLREGRTVFVDKRATGGVTFDKVVVSLSPSDEASLDMIRRSGHAVPGKIATHELLPDEGRCGGCGGLMAVGTLFEGRCTVCWATLAKAKGAP